MKIILKKITLFIFIIFLGCKGNTRIDTGGKDSILVTEDVVSLQEKKVYAYDGIYFDNRFDGSRINDVKKRKDSVYLITILPECEPVNQSPWFAFKVYASEVKEIFVSLDYQKFKHRYIPKLSRNGRDWEVYDGKINLNTDSTMATFSIGVSPDTLWISAQEIFSSDDMNLWIDEVIKNNKYLKKEVVGKTVMNQDIMVISSESKHTKNSVVLIARQHPPEVPGGTIGFKAFFKELNSDSKLAKEFRETHNLYVFPLLNPDGVDLGHWRHNANGVDLNRDWDDFLQPETSAVKNYLLDKVQNQDKIISFGLDFHTSYSGPYLLILDSLNEQKAQSQIIPRWIDLIDDDEIQVETRRRDQELPYCYNWFFKEFGSEAVTYEDGDEIDRHLIRNRAKHYANKLMEVLTKNVEQR